MIFFGLGLTKRPLKISNLGQSMLALFQPEEENGALFFLKLLSLHICVKGNTKSMFYLVLN